MSSQRGTHVRWALTGTLLLHGTWACAPDGVVGEQPGPVEGPLLARSSALWPVVGGKVEVHVCWAPPVLATAFPVASLAPDTSAAIAAHKEWVRAGVEREWSSRTAVQFVGWGDCGSGASDVHLVPIDSAARASCQTSQGQACAEYLGKELAGGKSVYLNMLFGDEVLYSSRYQQSHSGSAYVSSQDLSYWWLPQACFEDLRYAWSTNNKLTSHKVDITTTANRAAFDAIYESCLQFCAIHEFGHAAGFAHELQRRDAPTTRPNDGVACQVGGTPDVRYTADTPLGPYDPQSIMNYCRTDNTPTLSTEDVEQTNLVYGAAGSGGRGGGSGGRGAGGGGGQGSGRGGASGDGGSGPGTGGGVSGSGGSGGSASGGRTGGAAGGPTGGMDAAGGNDPAGGHGPSSGGTGSGGSQAGSGGSSGQDAGADAGGGGAATGGGAGPDPGGPGGAGTRDGGSACSVTPEQPASVWGLLTTLGLFAVAARARVKSRRPERL